MMQLKFFFSRMYRVVQFSVSEEVTVVPTTWIANDSETYWPPYKTDKKINQPVEKRVSPTQDWSWHGVRLLGKFYGEKDYI